MFGYIRPLECELKVRERELYRAFYCGLCQRIGKRIGQAARLSLQYDCAFLALFLASLTGDTRCAKGYCGIKPLSKPRPVAQAGAALDYAADANVYLAYRQLLDERDDEGSLRGYAGGAALSFHAAAIRRRRPAMTGDIDLALRKLAAIERTKSAQIDPAADAFGGLMRSLVSHAPGVCTQNLAQTQWMFYNLGRWIYLADAWDDRERDRKRGAYNVFNLCNTGREDAAFQLYLALSEAGKAYDLVLFRSDTGVLDNIMHLGCRTKTRMLLEEAES